MKPEFPIEKLNKEELLQLIEKMRQEYLFPPKKSLRELAFRVREKTLFDRYSATVEACSAASAKVQAVPSGQRAQFYDALAESVRLTDRCEHAYRKYQAFSDRGENPTCAP